MLLVLCYWFLVGDLVLVVKFSYYADGVGWMDGVNRKYLGVGGGPGFIPANDRTNIVVPYASRRPMIADIIPTVQTDKQVIEWMEQVTFTNNVSQIAEGGAKPASVLDWTATSAQCRHELTDFTALVTADHARRPFNPLGALTALGMMQAGVTRRNRRMGWGPDGSELVG